MQKHGQPISTLAGLALPALVWAAFLLPAEPLTAEKSSPLLSIKVSGNRLVVIAKEVGEMSLHGTFKTRSGQALVFDQSRLVKATDAKGTFFVADSFRVDSGKLVVGSGGSEWTVLDGLYARQGTEGQGNPRDPQPAPNPNSFEFKGGKMVEVTYEE